MGHNSLANFQIEKKIGRGQFSEVYRARYLLDNTSVALKKIQVRSVKAATRLVKSVTRPMLIYSHQRVFRSLKLTSAIHGAFTVEAHRNAAAVSGQTQLGHTR